MLSVVTTITIFLTALVLGGMVFFAAIFAPTVFRTLEKNAAGRLIRAVFPQYYRFLIVLTGAAAVCAALTPIGIIDTSVLAITALLFVFSLMWLMPRINQARDASEAGDESAETRFSCLHRASVGINMVQMIAVAVIFGRMVI